VTSGEYMLSVHGNSNEQRLAKLRRQEERRQEMRAWSKGKGLRPPRQDCWLPTQPITATSDPLGPDTNPSQHKKQINKNIY